MNNTTLSPQHQQVINNPPDDVASATSNKSAKSSSSFGTGTASGAAVGSVISPGLGTIIGAGVGLVGDVVASAVNNHHNKKINKENNKFNAVEAQKSREFNRASQKESENYNSAQNQVQQLKDAGLNPALMYSDFQSSSTPASSSPASASNALPSNMNTQTAQKFAELGLQSEVSKAQIDNLNSSSDNLDVDTVKQSINNTTLHLRNIAEIQKLFSEVDKMASDKSLNDEQIKQLQETRQSILDKYTAEIKALNTSSDLSVANKNYVEGAQTRESNARTSNLNSNTKYTNDVLTPNTQALTNEANARTNKTRLEYHQEAQKYLQDVKQIRMVSDFLQSHELPVGFTKNIVDILDNFAKESGQNLSDVPSDVIKSWLTGETILNFISSMKRTEAIKDGGLNQTEDETPQKSPSGKYKLFDDGINWTSEQLSYIKAREAFYNKLSDDDKVYIQQFSQSHTRMHTADEIQKLLNKYKYSKDYSNKR